ncbi:hypothetical protein GCM10027051_23770 [Niabella terrae]
MKNHYSFGKLVRYISIIAFTFWGFAKLYKEGMDSGGKTLLFMASIGCCSSLLFDFFKSKSLSQKS